MSQPFGNECNTKLHCTGLRASGWKSLCISLPRGKLLHAIHGIIPLVVEAGGACALDASVDEGAVCLLNIARHLQMIDGDPVLAPQQVMVSNYVVYRSLAGGYYIPDSDIQLGVTVRKGQFLGEVVDPVTSEVRERCESPVDGIVVSRRVRLPLNPGGYIARIADLDSVIWQRDN